MIRKAEGWNKIILYVWDIFCSLSDLFLRFRFYIQPEYKFKTQLSPVMFDTINRGFLRVYKDRREKIRSTIEQLQKAVETV